jgi:hypothetical protein
MKPNNKGKKSKNRRGGGSVPTNSRNIPIAKSVNVTPQRPSMSEQNGKTIVRGHEQFATLNGSTAFAATRKQINPGLSNIFAWLSDRAKGYEKYRIRKLEVKYVPAEAVVTTAGVVYLAFDYDPDDAPPTTLAALSSFEGLKQGHTFDVVTVKLDLKSVQRQMFKIRCGPKAGSRLVYDPASLIVSTISMTDASAVGQLWIGYEIELISPQLEPATPLPSSFSCYNGSANQALATTVAEYMDWDENVVDGLEFTYAAGVFSEVCGIFKVTGQITFSDSAAETFTSTIQVWKNGAPLPIPAISSHNGTSVAGGQQSIPFFAYVQLDDGDTFQVQITASGAAGTLATVADRSKLLIEAL